MASSRVILACVAATLTVPQVYAVQQILDTAPTTSCIKAEKNIMCVEGDTDYIEDALKRLQASNLQTGWQDSKVMAGPCKDQGMPNHVDWIVSGKLGECFPNATLWLKPEKNDGAYKVMSRAMNFNNKKLAEFNANHPDDNQAEIKIDCP